MNKLEKIKPFTKFCSTIGNIPTSYLISMTYEEQLIWLCNYLENTVIPSVNENISKTNELQVFIENYFNNLDVQEEIDNKLDEMAESGQLADIIAQYLNLACVLAYDTLSDLKNADNLVDGSIARTLGTTTYDDGLGSFYKIRELTESDVVDEVNIVSLTNSETLIAEKINNQAIIDLEDEVDSINTKLENITPKLVNSFYYYVDGVNGDDTNDGLTSETAFKTIEKLLSKYNEGATDLRGHIISAGNYTISDVNTLSNVTLHLNTNNLNIKPKLIFTESNKSIAIYQSHINLTNIELVQANPTEYRIYFEGCTIGMNNVTINDNSRIGFLGCNIEVTNLTCKRVQLSKTSGFINGLTITNTDNSVYAIEVEYSSGLRLYGNLNVSDLTTDASDNSSVLLRAIFSELNIMFTLNSGITHKYYYGLQLINTLTFITKNRFSYLYSYYGLNENALDNADIVQQNLTDTGWVDMTLTNGTAQDNNRYAPQYRVKNGVLYLHGKVNGLTEGDIITTLPASVPLTKRMTFNTPTDNISNYSFVRINEDREIILYKTNLTTPYVFLDGIVIPLDY